MIVGSQDSYHIYSKKKNLFDMILGDSFTFFPDILWDRSPKYGLPHCAIFMDGCSDWFEEGVSAESTGDITERRLSTSNLFG